jgi:hypothetical protein
VYTLDNFSAHEINYKPKNITLIPFEPNMTPFVQPLDAGIIRCVKAHYRRAFCMRAIELDEAEEPDIFKINLLEAMKMVREAWNAVSPTTIANCWDHTGIQHESAVPNPSTAVVDPAAEEARRLVRAWAQTTEGLPVVVDQLQGLLKDRFVAKDWHKLFDAVLGAEGNVQTALAALDAHPTPALPSVAPPNTTVTIQTTGSNVAHEGLGRKHISAQGREMEADLVQKIAELRQRNRIHGEPLTLDEILAPDAETEVGPDDQVVDGDDSDIVARVLHDEAVERGEVEEVESEEEDSDGAHLQDHTQPSSHDLQEMCRMLEAASLQSDLSQGTQLAGLLRRFRGELVKKELQSAKQTTLDGFMNR